MTQLDECSLFPALLQLGFSEVISYSNYVYVVSILYFAVDQLFLSLIYKTRNFKI